MNRRFKRILLAIIVFLFIFALIRISTSTYENLIRTAHP